MTRPGHLRGLKANGKGPRPNQAKQRRGPLRKIVGVIVPSTGLFDADLVELECGHRVRSNGQERARCNYCAKANERGNQ